MKHNQDWDSMKLTAFSYSFTPKENTKKRCFNSCKVIFFFSKSPNAPNVEKS